MQQSSTSSQNTLRIHMLKHMIYHLRLSTSLKLIGTENQNVFEQILAMFICFGMVLLSQITSESYRRDFVLLLQKHQLYVCYHILYLLSCYHYVYIFQTGYMFGKGIYTADLVTKAANYCHVLEAEGLILLCEVALGQIQEEKDARNIKVFKKMIFCVIPISSYIRS